MAKFHYSARNKGGEMQVGYVEAPNKTAAFNILNSHDLYILSMEEIRSKELFSGITNFFTRVKRTDVMIFTRQFATMLEAKISINDSLKNLHAQTRNLALKEAIFQINADIDSGLALSQSLARQHHIFSEFYINLVRSAEVTGRVEEAMGFLADYLEKEITLISKVRNALIYPAFVLGLFVVVASILIGFVFPQLEPIFAESNLEIPAITSILLSAGKVVANWWLLIAIIILGLIIMVWEYFKSSEGRALFDDISLRIPVLGKLFKKVYVTRFSESASVLLKGGIPVAQAIEISGHAIGSPIYQDALHRVAEAVRSGELLSVSLTRERAYFPPMTSQMVAIGEKTGKLEEMFDRVATFYSREVDAVVDNLVELIQPMLMVVMGVLVGLLFAAILVPIYNLVQTF
ncbi:MAG: type II secretion system F family protein [Candidatus Harrisonbacteria bacterium]|nr:type II secretion system F family protein [Candidatus Harrisonbacteria bacterium]